MSPQSMTLPQKSKGLDLSGLIESQQAKVVLFVVELTRCTRH